MNDPVDIEEIIRKKKDKRRSNSRWTITFIIWGIGGVGLSFLWEWQKTVPGSLGEIIALVLQVVAFFYALALVPIRDWVGRWLGD